ncbi:hypothetical protein GCM10009416_14280 [Craurococcus roseus]|uniref:Uncharacterized protein n=1 Tax=Craurococcus roseus TaxID=77585 RepID=A0ABN1EY59_9PROT
MPTHRNAASKARASAGVNSSSSQGKVSIRAPFSIAAASIVGGDGTTSAAYGAADAADEGCTGASLRGDKHPPVLNEIIHEFLEVAAPELPGDLHLMLACWGGQEVVHLTARTSPAPTYGRRCG